jgi:hypothetical protein
MRDSSPRPQRLDATTVDEFDALLLDQVVPDSWWVKDEEELRTDLAFILANGG